MAFGRRPASFGGGERDGDIGNLPFIPVRGLRSRTKKKVCYRCLVEVGLTLSAGREASFQRRPLFYETSWHCQVQFVELAMLRVQARASILLRSGLRAGASQDCVLREPLGGKQVALHSSAKPWRSRAEQGFPIDL